MAAPVRPLTEYVVYVIRSGSPGLGARDSSSPSGHSSYISVRSATPLEAAIGGTEGPEPLCGPDMQAPMLRRAARAAASRTPVTGPRPVPTQGRRPCRRPFGGGPRAVPRAAAPAPAYRAGRAHPRDV